MAVTSDAPSFTILHFWIDIRINLMTIIIHQLFLMMIVIPIRHGAAVDAAVKSPHGGVVPRQNQVLNWARYNSVNDDIHLYDEPPH